MTALAAGRGEFEDDAGPLASLYESYSADQLNAWIKPFLPAAGSHVLDVGAGSGRDAAWLAERGLLTVAVEPAAGMREQCALAHGAEAFELRAGSLPGLPCAGESYALVLLNAVWMFIPTHARPAACAELADLLAPGGVLAATLRDPIDAARGMEPADAAGFAALAARHGLRQAGHEVHPDPLRPDVQWDCIALRKP